MSQCYQILKKNDVVNDVVHVEVGEAQVVVGGHDDDFQLAHMPCANRNEVYLEEANGVTCAKDEDNIEEADVPHNGGDEDLEDLPYNDGDEDWLEDDDDHGALYKAKRRAYKTTWQHNYWCH